MEYQNKGFSNIKLPKISGLNGWYSYNETTNKFPEEVFVHEFLHSLEKNSKKYGYNVPDLHSYANNGYSKQSAVGLYSWYKDYMNSNIGDKKLGLNSEVYELKPLSSKNFNKCKVVDEFNDIDNVAGRLALVIKTINNNI